MEGSGTWQLLGSDERVQTLRTTDLYRSMMWDQGMDLGSQRIAIAPYGGPIAVTRDPSKLSVLRAGTTDSVTIYSAAGRLVRREAYRGGGREH